MDGWKAAALRLHGLAFVLCLGLIGCNGVSQKSPNKKVIVLGIDGMDPGFLERHWNALPHLNQLRKSGDFQRLATTIPPQSPVAWSTFITGLDPGGHGIFDFVHRDPSTLRPFSSMGEIELPTHFLSLGRYLLPLSSGRIRRFMRGEAFWQILDRAHVPVTLLRMPNNFPPIESRSQTLSGMGTPDMNGTFGTFTFFTDDPEEQTRRVAGGQIIEVTLEDNRADLIVRGPPNNLLKQHNVSLMTLTVHRDPVTSTGLFEVDGQQFVLQQGEWSPWIRVGFPILPGIKKAAGMFRIYAKALAPQFQIYVSPINIDPSSPELPISTPAVYSRRLAEAIGPFYTQGIAEDTAALRQGVLTREEFRQQTRSVGDEQIRMLESALRTFTRGVLFLHYSPVDQDSHMLWGDHDEELVDTYRRVDKEVGHILEVQPDATLIVMSDHGFSSFRRAVNLNTWLWQQGFLALDSSAKRDQEGSFAHIDWAHTQAYSLGLNAVYVNLAGRERFGSVLAQNRNELISRIADGLEKLHDPQNGSLAVHAVYRANDVYHGDAKSSAPDLIVGWSNGYRSSWQGALGSVSSAVIEDNKDEWRGDHCIAADLVPGVFLSNVKAHRTNLWLGDLTVTLLKQFDAVPTSNMRGQSIF